MEKLRWYFKHGTKFEEYSVLYKKDGWILVMNDDTKKISFGLERDFGTLYGFPVNQSCLTNQEAKELLKTFIDIDNDYIYKIGDIARENIVRWNEMVEAIA